MDVDMFMSTLIRKDKCKIKSSYRYGNKHLKVNLYYFNKCKNVFVGFFPYAATKMLHVHFKFVLFPLTSYFCNIYQCNNLYSAMKVKRKLLRIFHNWNNRSDGTFGFITRVIVLVISQASIKNYILINW